MDKKSVSHKKKKKIAIIKSKLVELDVKVET